MSAAPGCARRRSPMARSARRGACDEREGDAALGSLHPLAQRARAQACRQRACGRCDDGAAGGARRLYAPRRGAVDLGGAVGGDHRLRPRRQGHDVRADGLEDLPPPHLLQGARRGREYVSGAVADAPLFTYTLRLADNALILGHRLSEWIGHAPLLEEELALGNIALDLIGEARALYTYAGAIEGQGRDEDALAYRRDAGDFHNILLVEQPNGDFAATIVRQFLYAAFMEPFWRALGHSRDATLAAIAAKSQKETAYHRRHAGEWLIRLGDGTEESHRRAQDALDELWPYTGELFETDAVDEALIAQGVAADPAPLRPEWESAVAAVLEEATLQRPAASWMQSGGRAGRHSEHLGHLLATMQFLQRAYPGATW